MSSLTLEPIGYVRCGKQLKFETPNQPRAESGETNQVVLEPGRQFELALQDLAGFDRIWLLFWFDRNDNWRPRVLPPRGAPKRRGVFATRSPHRPNPIGLTSVPLLNVEGLTLTVGPLDLMDGTPILDIKPYISTIDSHPESSLGWLEEIEASGPRYEVEVSELARRQLTWLRENWGIDFTERAFTLLKQDPTPHRTRRILGLGADRYRIACGPWRLFFTLSGQTVMVEEVGKGYSDESLQAEGWEKIPDRDAQVAFAVASPSW